MQFDPWSFEPPLGEFSRAVGRFCVAACILGWLSCLWTLIRRRTTRTDWAVWGWALLAGALVGAMLLLALHAAPPDPFIALLFDWTIGSAFAASMVVLGFRGTERRVLGRRMLEASALFVVAMPISAVLTGIALRLAGR
jgi:drug/metabolite transporter (DMT)-like permease